jgi:hypothetical protein
MQPFQTHDDVMGNHTDIIPVSDYVLVLMLSPAAAKTVVVPPNARIVLFSATGSFWLSGSDAPALPAGDILDGTAPELNPGGRTVRPGQTLGLVASAACTVTLSFYG